MKIYRLKKIATITNIPLKKIKYFVNQKRITYKIKIGRYLYLSENGIYALLCIKFPTQPEVVEEIMNKINLLTLDR